MFIDFYELTMANGYFNSKMKDEITYFDLFFRNVPDNGGIAVAAGLSTLIEYIQDLKFSDEDIEYLRSKNMFSEDFLEYLRSFKFHGDIYAVPEGSVVFPNEPLVTVKANAIEAQIIETYLLLALNHQSLIATKASRIVRAAEGKVVMELGSRRAQGESAAILGAKAAYIAGGDGTACAMSDMRYGVPAYGTMAHSWVQMFKTEYEAFETYCKIYPNNVTLLVDTYNVLKSGIPNAIKAIKNILWPQGIKKCAIRLDSGDFTYLSKKARKMLDDAGLTDCKIVVSNSLDEHLIREMLHNGAQIDSFGVGERLITAKSDPVFGGVYKLCAIEHIGEIIPKIKISENEQKIINPHFKKIYRLYSKENDKAIADLLCVYDETINANEDLEIFDPYFTWKRKTITNYYVREMLQPIFINGELVYKVPTIEESREYHKKEIDSLWDEVKRFENPHSYYVDLSQKLWDIKNSLLAQFSKK